VSDATFDSTKQSLKTVLEDARDGGTQLPDFQRGWVWDDEHIRDLLASISRAFPIGAVMLLETGGEVRFKNRVIEGADVEQVEPERLILDGQQRLTSLFQSLLLGRPVVTRDAKKNEIERWYYIDMATALDPDADRIDAVLSVPPDRVIRTNFGRDVVADYSSPEKEYAAKVFPVAKIFDPFEWRAGFNRFWNYEPDMVAMWDRFEQEIVTRFSTYLLPVIELDKRTPKEAVCLVFEKVNTGGVPLSVFELLTATFAADGFDLRESWEQVRRNLLERAPKLLAEVANTDFLQVISLLASYERRRTAIAAGASADNVPQVTCKRRDILRLTLDDYLRWVEPATTAMGLAARFLINEHIYETRFLPYQTQIVPLAAIHAIIGAKSEEYTTKEQLGRWFWCGVFGELYGSTVETRFARDVLDVPSWIDAGAEPRTITEANFAPERLLSLRTRGSAAYKGIYVMLLKQGARDFRTGDTATVQSYFEDAIDIHHIFPKHWCEDQEIDPRQRESIVNKTPLTARTNRIIGGGAPSTYLKSLRERHGASESSLNENLKSHLILSDALLQDDFNAHFEWRQQALLEQISTLMGKTLQNNPEERQDTIDELDFFE
jgi:hypothetical protein